MDAVLGVLDDEVRAELDAQGFGWDSEDKAFLAAVANHADALHERYS